jgi:polar amino acid transport system ATP-binding protein
MSIPVINIEHLLQSRGDKSGIAADIHLACRDHGFFYITGHGVKRELQDKLEVLSWKFFSQPEEKKSQIAMELGGIAWRGYFPVLSELTSGRPDRKEGLYFGEELAADDHRVKSHVPLHGVNLFPDIPGFKATILEYVSSMANLGRILMGGVALSLELPEAYFEDQLMSDPFLLFRIFHYPAQSRIKSDEDLWGVGEHTDYGVLTILKQDSVGGLQVYTRDNWVDAPFIEDSFICNIGDMLDRMTGGYYRSTPHRVLSNSKKGRLSFPFFYDLSFDAVPVSIDLAHLGQQRPVAYERWDQSDIQAYSGTYGEYLVQKVSKVFPLLKDNLK